jgi:hypothetical protein
VVNKESPAGGPGEGDDELVHEGPDRPLDPGFRREPRETITPEDFVISVVYLSTPPIR